MNNAFGLFATKNIRLCAVALVAAIAVSMTGCPNDTTRTEGGTFVPATDITGVPTTATAGTPLTLTGAVVPSGATNQAITWSVQNPGTTGATVSGNTLNAMAAGTATVRATIAGGTNANTAFTQDFAVTVNAGFVPVTGITDVPTTAIVGTPLTLAATIQPSNATNQAIAWSVHNPGTTGVTISGNTLDATAAGTATVRATIAGGTDATTAFTQDFTVTVNAGFVPVTGITDVPTTAIAGMSLTLAATVQPSNATNQTIAWSVHDAGTTGATVSGNTLNATAGGMLTLRVTITDGLAVGMSYTRDFPITVQEPPRHTLTIRVATPGDLNDITSFEFTIEDRTGGRVEADGILEKFEEMIVLQEAALAMWGPARREFREVLERGLTVIIEGPDVPMYDWFKIVGWNTVAFHINWLRIQTLGALRFFLTVQSGSICSPQHHYPQTHGWLEASRSAPLRPTFGGT